MKKTLYILLTVIVFLQMLCGCTNQREAVLYGDGVKTWKCDDISMSFYSPVSVTNEKNGEIMIDDQIYLLGVYFGLPNYQDMVVFITDETGTRTLIGANKVTIISKEKFKAKVYYSDLDSVEVNKWLVFQVE